MPLRLFIYLARVYEKIINSSSIYSTRLIEIPKPELIVLYNGMSNFPDEKVLKLSDTFCNTELNSLGSSLELEVKVININHNNEIVRKSENLSGYVEFIETVKQNIKNGLDRENAIITAIKSCIDCNILVEFLEDNSSEVINMLFNEFNIEDYGNIRKEDGKLEQAFETAKTAIAENLPISMITKLTGLSEDKIKAIKI